MIEQVVIIFFFFQEEIVLFFIVFNDNNMNLVIFWKYAVNKLFLKGVIVYVENEVCLCVGVWYQLLLFIVIEFDSVIF